MLKDRKGICNVQLRLLTRITEISRSFGRRAVTKGCRSHHSQEFSALIMVRKPHTESLHDSFRCPQASLAEHWGDSWHSNPDDTGRILP